MKFYRPLTAFVFVLCCTACSSTKAPFQSFQLRNDAMIKALPAKCDSSSCDISNLKKFCEEYGQPCPKSDLSEASYFKAVWIQRLFWEPILNDYKLTSTDVSGDSAVMTLERKVDAPKKNTFNFPHTMKLCAKNVDGRWVGFELCH